MEIIFPYSLLTSSKQRRPANSHPLTSGSMLVAGRAQLVVGLFYHFGLNPTPKPNTLLGLRSMFLGSVAMSSQDLRSSVGIPAIIISSSAENIRMVRQLGVSSALSSQKPTCLVFNVISGRVNECT